MHPLVLIALILIGAFLIRRWLGRVPPTQARKLALAGMIVVIVLLALTGKLNPLFALVAAMIPILMRAIHVLQYVPLIQRLARQMGAAPSRAGATSRQSSIATRYLRMTLDHATGALQGEVLEGRYRGKALADLPLDSLLQLYAEVENADRDSMALLEAYLDRVHGDAWRQQAGTRAGGGGPATNGSMSRDEAYAVLGLSKEASNDDVVAAHRRLMQKLHPDRGGSDYLAAKINQAKDYLLQS